MDKILFFLNTDTRFSLVFFLIILGFYLWYAFSIVYHLIRFGIGTKPKILALIFFVGSVLLFSITIDAYNEVDWQYILEKILNNPFK